jgi:hypothetical protein
VILRDRMAKSRQFALSRANHVAQQQNVEALAMIRAGGSATLRISGGCFLCGPPPTIVEGGGSARCVVAVRPGHWVIADCSMGKRSFINAGAAGIVQQRQILAEVLP